MVMIKGTRRTERESDGRSLRWQSVCRRFTLAEALIAVAFAAVVIPVAVNGVTSASRAGLVALRQREAVHLGEQLLKEWTVTNEWIDEDYDGDFGDERPLYRWGRFDEFLWEEDENITMQILTLVVYYTVAGEEYETSLTILVPYTDDEEFGDL